MGDVASLLAAIDRVSGQFAIAMRNSELTIYSTLTLLLILGVFLFPPRDDRDQV